MRTTSRGAPAGPTLDRIARRAFAPGIIALALAACTPKADPDAASQTLSRPLASLGAQPVALLPVQYLRAGGISDQLGPSREFLRAVDDAIAAELAKRGTGRNWVLPATLARSAQRNPASGTDPYALAGESLRSGVRRTNPRLGEPLASQVRSMIATTDARYALVPAEIRFDRTPEGVNRAALRLVLIDGRLAEIQWAGDVALDVPTPNVAVIAAEIARRVVDLVADP